MVVQLCDETSQFPRLAVLRCDLDKDHEDPSHFDRVLQVYWTSTSQGGGK